MFNPNSIPSEEPGSLQQPSGPLPQSNPDERNHDPIEVETNDLNRYFCGDCQEREYDWNELSELVENINSDDRFKQYSGLIGVRKLLNLTSDGDEGQIQKVIDACILSKLVEFMKKDEDPQLQLEATKILCGITTGNSDQIREIIDKEALPVLVKLLSKSRHTELLEHVVLAITNIAFEPQYRDFLLDHEVLNPLLDVLKEALEKKDNTLIKQGASALSKLCRTKPQPAYERIAEATPVLCRVVQEISDIDIIHDAMWALSTLSELCQGARVFEADIIPFLVKYLDCSNNSVIIPTLRTLGHIIAGEDDQADVLLKGPWARSYVKKLFTLLKQKYDHKNTRKEICWTLSNIACRGSNDIDLVIGNPEYIKQLINVALYDIPEVQIEAVWTLSNVTEYGDKNQLISMARNGVLDCLYKLIQQDLPDDQIIVVALNGIQNFLAFGDSMSRKEASNNKYVIKLKQKSVLKRVKELQGSQNSEISEQALGILRRYLKGHILRKKLRLKRAVICFRNERHTLFGLFQNKKKRLSV